MTSETRLYGRIAPLANVQLMTELVMRLQERTHGLPGMACFHGRAGDGKSKAALYAANKHGGVLVEVEHFWSPKMLVLAILDEMGVKPRRGDAIGQIAQTIEKELAISGAPLLIDEADHLMKKDMIEIVRGIHDKSGAPVILIGEEEMPQKLRERPRVHGRMLDWVPSQPATLDELMVLAPIYAAGVEIEADLRAEIFRASRGSTRYIAINLAKVAELARTEGLDRICLADWEAGAKALHTGEAPLPRRALA